MTTQISIHRRIVAALVALAAALGIHLAVSPAAQADPAPVVGGGASWGFSQEIRTLFKVDPPDNYNSSFPNDPDQVFWYPFDGTTRVQGVEAWRFPASSGTYDASTQSVEATMSGGLRIGYCVGGFRPGPTPVDCPGTASPPPPTGPFANGIYVVFKDLELEIDGNQGTLSGDSWAGFHGSKPAEHARRAFASLDLTGITPQVDGDTVTWTGVKTTLTKEGEPLGLGTYKEGTVLDPIDISLQLDSGSGEEEEPPAPSGPEEDLGVSGTVGGELGLTLDQAQVALGTFLPGVAADYDATVSGQITSTGPATLTVADAGPNPGFLLNGSTPLANALKLCATAATAPSCSHSSLGAGALALLSTATGASAEPITVGLRQSISASEPLTAGTYGKTLTFTLSAGTP